MIFRVKGSRVNVRSGPGLGYAVLDQLDVGEYVEPVPEGWIPVQMVDSEPPGWVSAQYLEPVDQLPEVVQAPWLNLALGELGVSEIVGNRDNPRIVEYLRVSNPKGSQGDLRDETAWCAAFVGWVMLRSGRQGTGTWWAKDWLKWGRECNPYPGCVVVFTRGSGGHVAFYLDEDADRILCLGGNQSNKVCQAWYSKGNFLGYREPA